MGSVPSPIELWLVGDLALLQPFVTSLLADHQPLLHIRTEPPTDRSSFTLVVAWPSPETKNAELVETLKTHASLIEGGFLITDELATEAGFTKSLTTWIELGVTGWGESSQIELIQAWLSAAQRRSERAARTNPKSLESQVVRALPDSYLIVDRDGVFVDRMGQQSADREEESLTGRSMHEVLPPELVESCVALGQRAWDSNSKQVAQLAYRQSKEVSWLEVTAAPLDERMLLVGVRDVTPQVRDHRLLQVHRRLLNLLHSMTESGHFEWNLDNDQLWISPALARLLKLGNAPVEMSLDAIRTELVPAQHVADLNQHIDTFRADPKSTFIQMHVRRTDGEVRIGWCIVQPMPRIDGEPRMAFGAFHDITDQAYLREQLLRRERELDEVARISSLGLLASQVAHQLNQPLFSITNYAEACRLQLESLERSSAIESVLTWLDRIVAQARTTGESLRRMTRWLQRRPAELAENNLVDSLRETIAMQQDTLRQKEIKLSTSWPSEPCIACFDRVLMRQLISNLIENSIEAMEETSAESRILGLSVQHHPTHLELVVRDRGVGLDPTQFPKLCQPFISTNPESLGIGLSIAKAISESFGGRISAAAVPDGTEIHVTIPTNVPRGLAEVGLPRALSQ